MNEDMTELPAPLFQWLHTHGRVVGFSYRKRFVYPHKASVAYSHYVVSEKLSRRAERRVNCPGGVACGIRQQLEHQLYRIRKGVK